MNQVGDTNTAKHDISKDNSGKLHKISRAVGLVLVVVSSIYFIGIIIRYSSSLPQISWDVSTFLTLVTAAMIYMGVIGIGIIVWFILLKGVGIEAGILETGSVFTVAQFSKYIPGNVAQHLSRLAISSARGWNAAKVLLTMVIEASWSVLASALLAGLALFVVGESASGWFNELPSIGQIILVAVSVLLLVVFVILGVRFLLPAVIPSLSDLRQIELPSIGVLIVCFLLSLFSYLLMGLLVQTLSVGMLGESSADFWLLAGIFAVAWITGFLTPGAPAGLGVREAVLVAALSPIFGSGTALGITVAARLVTTIMDGIVFLIGLGVGRALRISTRADGEPGMLPPASE